MKTRKSVGEKLQQRNGFLEIMSNATEIVMGYVSSTFFSSIIFSFGGNPPKKNIHMHPPVSHMLRLRVSVC